MGTTIITKNGSGAPAASDLVAGELAVDLTNKRLYTEDSGANILELGSNPSTIVVAGTSTLTGNVTASSDVSVGGNLTVTGNATIEGNLTFGNAATDTITLGADVASHILPSADDTYDLGSSSAEWRNIYIDGTAYLDAINFNGTAITATAAELNILDGVTSTAAELNILDGVTSTAAELNILDGVTSTAAELNILDGVTATTAELNILDGVTSTAAELNILDGVTSTAAELNILDGVTSTAAELNLVDGSSAGTIVNSKAVVYGSSGEVNATTLQIAGTSITSTAAELNILDGVTATAAELNILDGVTATTAELNYLDVTTLGTVEASKAVTADANADVKFGDSDKAIFGAGSDLQIYHDGTNSYISDQGTNDLKVLATDFQLKNAADSEFMMTAVTDGAVTAYHNGSAKLATTSAGIDVTGTVTADGLNVATGSFTINTASAPQITSTGSVKIDIDSDNNATDNRFLITSDGGTNDRLQIGENGDFSLFEDTGTTAKLFWDASAESLGIGTTSPAKLLDVAGAIRAVNSAGSSAAEIDITSGSTWRLRSNPTTGTNSYGLDIIKGSAGTDVKMSVDSSGNVGIGTASPSGDLEIATSAADTGVDLVLDGNRTSNGGIGSIIFNNSGDSVGMIRSNRASANDAADMLFYTQATGGANTERMRINSSGYVGIGTSSPAFVLDVSHASDNGLARFTSGDADAYITLSDVNSSSAYNKIGVITHDMYFNTNNAERMRIDSSGRLLVGLTASDGILASKIQSESTDASAGFSAHRASADAGGPYIVMSSSRGASIGDDTIVQDGDSLGYLFWTGADGTDRASHAAYIEGFVNGTPGENDMPGAIRFATTSDGAATASERMRIDSSGNLLVGTTDSAPGVADTNVGVALNSGRVFASAEDDYALNLNRNTNDGDITRFRKDGTTVGSIGVSGGNNLYISGIAADHSGLTFATNQILPSEQGALTDAQESLGNSSNRFSEAYLSSNLKVGGSSSFQFQKSGTHGYINQSDSGSLIFRMGSGYSERMRIDSSGRVGIGGTPNTSWRNDLTDVVLMLGTEATFHSDGGVTTELWNNSYVDNSDDFRNISTRGASRYQQYAGAHKWFTAASASAGTEINAQLNATPKMELDVSGNLLKNGNGNIQVGGYNSGTAYGLILTPSNTSTYWHMYNASGGNLVFGHSSTIGSTEKARIDSSGNLLVGKTATTATDAGLVLQGVGMAKFTRNDWSLLLNRIGSSNGEVALFQYDSGTVGSISVTSSATAFNTSSDQRLKDNIVDAPSASDDIDAIQVRSFDWRADGSHQKYGMVAQELVTVAPSAVSQPEDPEEMMGVDYSKLVPMLIKEVQQLRARVAQLEGEN